MFVREDFLRYLIKNLVNLDLTGFQNLEGLGRILILLLVICITLPAFSGQIDEQQIRLLNQLETPFRWDNVEGEPYQVSGENPDYSLRHRLHWVELLPGEEMTVKLPPFGDCRVISSSAITSRDLEFSYSNGSGLHLISQPISENNSLIFSPELPDYSLVRLKRQKFHETPIKIAVFVSRHENLNPVIHYRDEITLPLKTVKIREEENLKKETFGMLPAGQDVSMEIHGKCRLALETRLIFPSTETNTSQTYWLRTKIDDEVPKIHEFNSFFESGELVFVDGTPQILANTETIFLDIPKGNHRLNLHSFNDIYLRILKRKDNYLLSNPLPVKNGLSDSINIEMIEQTALSLSRDNAHRDAPLLGWQLLQSQRRSDYPAINAEAQFIRNMATFYRDLLPFNSPDSVDQHFAYFLTDELKDYQMETEKPVVASQFINYLADIIPAGYFVSVSPRREPLQVEKADITVVQSDSLTEFVLFDFDKSFIREEHRDQLTSVVELLKKNPDLIVYLDAHTDSCGTYGYNEALSVRRALSVRNFLLRLGLDPKRILWSSHGEYIPRASNRDSLGRQLNRRVRLQIELPSSVVASKKEEINRELVYHLPERSADSQLRVIVDRTGLTQDSEFMLQFDDNSPMRFLIFEEHDVGDDQFRENRAQAVLSEMSQGEDWRNGTLSGNFSRENIPAPLLDCGIIELALPKDVRKIRLWKDETEEQAIYVALEYRAAKQSFMTEMQYLSLISQVEHPDSLQHWFLAFLNDQPTPDSFVMNELKNQWLPLKRLLKASQEIITNSVQENAYISQQSTGNLSAEEEKLLHQKAEAFERKEEWELALACWNQLLYYGHEAKRKDALLGRIRSLQGLGEWYLAEMFLRGLYLYDDDEDVRSAAFDALYQMKKKEDDASGQLILAATNIEQNSTSEALKILAESLANDGKYEFALLTVLAITPDERPVEPILRASYKIGWWHLFDETLKTVSDNERKNYWLGMKASHHRNFDKAIQYLKKSDSEGTLFAEHLEKGMEIRNRLTSSDRSERIDASLDWERWHGENPQEKFWRVNGSLVTSYKNSESIYNINRDLYSTMYRCDDKIPVRAKILGAKSIKIDFRPVHQTTGKSLNGWIHINIGGHVRHIPILNNLPNENLEIIGKKGEYPGMAISKEIHLGVGLHNIEISSQSVDGLVQISEAVPEMASGVLPPLTQENLISVVNGDFYQENKVDDYDEFRLITGENNVETRRKLSSSLRRFVAERNSRRFASRVTQSVTAGFPRKAWESEVDPSEAVRNLWITTTSSRGIEGEQILRAYEKLLWIKENEPEKAAVAIAHGEKLWLDHRDSLDIKSLYNRLMLNTEVIPVSSVENSAGLRYMELEGWNPASPSLNIRKSLISPVSPEEHILYGDNTLGLNLKYYQPRELTLKFTLQELDFIPIVPVTLFYQLDYGETNQIELHRESLHQEINVSVPAGKHTLRIWLKEAFSNQFIRIHITEKKLTETAVAEPLIHTFRRSYHVATHDEPIRFKVHGPLVLRSDEWREGATFRNYTFFDDGWHEVEMTPTPDQHEALFRFFYRIPPLIESSPGEVRAEILETPPDSIPFASIRFPENLPTLKRENNLPLGGQEDGTVSVGTSYEHQYEFEENDNNAASDAFFETSVAYRSYNPWKERYIKAELFARYNADREPTLGIAPEVHFSEFPFNLRFNIQTSFYAQQAVHDSTGEGNLEWAAFIKGTLSQIRPISEKWYHRPLLAVFVRQLSLESEEAVFRRPSDQDVFTFYKADHQAGLIFAERVSYTPWLDTEVWSEGTLRLNQNFDPTSPDRLQFQLGGKQLINDIQLDLDWSITHYFDDEDRDESITKNVVSGEILWERWLNAHRHRLELGVEANYDFRNAETDFMMLLRWHWANGRDYRDFLPGEIGFEQVRRLRVGRK